jgi:hypothetical protein
MVELRYITISALKKMVTAETNDCYANATASGPRGSRERAELRERVPAVLIPVGPNGAVEVGSIAHQP